MFHLKAAASKSDQLFFYCDTDSAFFVVGPGKQLNPFDSRFLHQKPRRP